MLIETAVVANSQRDPKIPTIPLFKDAFSRIYDEHVQILKIHKRRSYFCDTF